MKPVLYIRYLLGSKFVYIFNFAGGSSSWQIAKNVFPILFNPLQCSLHNRMPLVERLLSLFDPIAFSLPDLSVTLCHEILKEVVVHFHMQNWLIRRCTGLFQGLIGHQLSKVHQHQSFIGSIVIHDKRQRRLFHVTQIFKCESSSFALS